MTSWYLEEGLSPEDLPAQIFSILENGLHAFGTTIKAPQPVRGTSMNKAPRRGRR